MPGGRVTGMTSKIIPDRLNTAPLFGCYVVLCIFKYFPEGYLQFQSLKKNTLHTSK